MKNHKDYKDHKCKGTSGKEVEVIYTAFNDETIGKQWWFHIYQKATEKDLEDGEADQIGELIFSTVIAISFCPLELCT